MSDSRPKENVEAGKAQKPVSAESTPIPENRPKSGMPDNTPEIKGKTWPVWLLGTVLVAAIAGFGWVLASQLFFGPSGEKATTAPATTTTTASSPSDDAPLSIIPADEEGVTVLEKQSGPANTDQTAGLAPVAQGADIATGFAMDLGSARSFLDLSRRFANIAAVNGPENFQRLEPRAILRDTVTGLEARLLIGPFETRNEAFEACAILVLDITIKCEPAPFEGELIPRN